MKDFTRHAFQIYINSSIHVALAVASFAGITSFYLGISPPVSVYLFLFFCSIAGYNFIKYYHTWFRHSIPSRQVSGAITAITMLAITGIAFTVAWLPVKVLFAACAAAIVTLLYILPVFPKKAGLRRLYGTKIFIISLVWAITTVWVPVAGAERSAHLPGSLLAIESVQRFLLVFALTLPFDIRDVRADSGTLTSIPAIIGLKHTRILAGILLVLIGISEILRPGSEKAKTFLFILFSLIIFAAMYNSHYRQTPYYASFWVEGIPTLWFLSVFLFNLDSM